jgi:hypothetical protein
MVRIDRKGEASVNLHDMDAYNILEIFEGMPKYRDIGRGNEADPFS